MMLAGRFLSDVEQLRLSLGRHVEPGQVLAMVGATSRSGVSVATAALGQSFARVGQATIIIDAHVAHARQHRLAGLGREPGLWQLLADEMRAEAVCQATTAERLQVVPCGRKGGRVVPVFGAEKWRRTLRELAGEDRIALVDAGRLHSAVAMSAVSASDACVLVIESGRSLKPAIGHAIGQLEASGANVIGLLINKRRFVVPRWLYGRS